MSHEGSEWNDQTILDATKQIATGTHKQFKITLPDGSPLTSENMPIASIKAGTLIAWCQAVRETIASKENARKDENERKRQQRKSQAAPSAPAPSVDASASTPPAKTEVTQDDVRHTARDTHANPTSNLPGEDPADYARRQLVGLTSAVEAMERRMAELKSELQTTKGLRHKWAVIVQNLEIEPGDDHV